MGGKPDFLWGLNSRTNALVGVGCSFAAWASFALLTLITPLKNEPVWVDGLAIASVLGLAGIAAVCGPRIAKGGTYRVLICGNRLRVSSPFRGLGPTFEVALPAITRLLARKNSEGDERFDVEAGTGRSWRIHAGCGRDLFEAIRLLRPDLDIARGS